TRSEADSGCNEGARYTARRPESDTADCGGLRRRERVGEGGSDHSQLHRLREYSGLEKELASPFAADASGKFQPSMRILILSQWFDPEPTFKGLLFARELAARGHKVEVLTGFPNYPGGKIYPGYRIRPWVRERLDGIDVWGVALYRSHNNSGLHRVFNYASFALSAAVIGTALIRKPDVMYVYHPPITV